MRRLKIADLVASLPARSDLSTWTHSSRRAAPLTHLWDGEAGSMVSGNATYALG